MKNPSTKTINPTTTESEIVLTYEDVAIKHTIFGSPFGEITFQTNGNAKIRVALTPADLALNILVVEETSLKFRVVATTTIPTFATMPNGNEVALSYEDIAEKVYDFLPNAYAVDNCEVTEAVISALEKLENC